MKKPRKNKDVAPEPRRLPWPAQAVAAGFLIGWRVLTQPLGLLWRDYVLLVSAFWLFCLLRPQSPALPRILLSLAAYLLAIYAAGQFHHTLAALGFGT